MGLAGFILLGDLIFIQLQRSNVHTTMKSANFTVKHKPTLKTLSFLHGDVLHLCNVFNLFFNLRQHFLIKSTCNN